MNSAGYVDKTVVTWRFWLRTQRQRVWLTRLSLKLNANGQWSAHEVDEDLKFYKEQLRCLEINHILSD